MKGDTEMIDYEDMILARQELDEIYEDDPEDPIFEGLFAVWNEEKQVFEYVDLLE